MRFFFKKQKPRDKELPKMPSSLFSFGHLLLGSSLPLRVVSPVRFPWRKQIFICKWLSIGDCFWTRNRGMFPLLSTLGPYLVQTNAGPLPVVSVSMSPCVCWLFLSRGPCFLGVLHYLQLLQSFFLFFCEFSDPWNVWWKYPAKAECSKIFHFLPNFWLWVSLCLLPSFAGGRFSAGDWARNWSMSITNMSLGTILLLLSPTLFRTVVFDFTPGSWAI